MPMQFNSTNGCINKFNLFVSKSLIVLKLSKKKGVVDLYILFI